ncbi:MAG TPA: TlpA disulfide reductase family protein [Mucilaginibacter sp.]|nr:TlpA disulfide reductase family protein [Mucilaginibacter sp.]
MEFSKTPDNKILKINKLKEMKFSIHAVTTIMLFFVFSSSFAQNKITNLNIGDQCPDVVLSRIVNYHVDKAKISDFKGKYLILDFWATWCAPCVTMMDTIDMLQKKFANRVQFMPVTYQDEKTVNAFFANRKLVKFTLSTSVVDDTLLNKMFSHSTIPHYVWIDPNGKVFAITSSESINMKTIQDVVNAKLSVLPVNSYKELPVHMNSVFFEIGNPDIGKVNTKNILSKSVLTGYVENEHSYATSRDPNRIAVINQSISNIYKYTFGYGNKDPKDAAIYFLSDNRIVWDIRDSTLNSFSNRVLDSISKSQGTSGYIAWMQNHGFCYELTVPLKDSLLKYQYARIDINSRFNALLGITASLEKRKVKCLILIRTSNIDKIASKGGEEEMTADAYHFHLKNNEFNWLMARLATYYFQLSPEPLVDETGFAKFAADLDLHCKMSNVEDVNKELAKYDLKFIEGERDLDMIVIKKGNQ